MSGLQIRQLHREIQRNKKHFLPAFNEEELSFSPKDFSFFVCFMNGEPDIANPEGTTCVKHH